MQILGEKQIASWGTWKSQILSAFVNLMDFFFLSAINGDNKYSLTANWLIYSTTLDRPKIVKPNASEVSELLSSNFTVECLAEGSPDPWYVWTNVADGNETLGGNLTIENVNDLNGRNYTYTCTATNDLGCDERTVSIEITSTFHHFDVIMKIYIIVPSAHCCWCSLS